MSSPIFSALPVSESKPAKVARRSHPAAQDDESVIRAARARAVEEEIRNLQQVLTELESSVAEAEKQVRLFSRTDDDVPGTVIGQAGLAKYSTLSMTACLGYSLVCTIRIKLCSSSHCIINKYLKMYHLPAEHHCG